MSSRGGRPENGNGNVYQRNGSVFWWMWYRDREGKLRRESTGTADEQEANRILRDRLDARDDGRLPAILAGKSLTFDQWADWFLENRSKPPNRKEKTHLENLNALKFLRPRFGKILLAEISAGGVADHFVTQMLRQGDSAVFKRYSQAKLNMMREALARLDRKANEHERSSGTARPN